MAGTTYKLQQAVAEKILRTNAMNAVVATLVPLLKQTRGNVYKKLRGEVQFTADEISIMAKYYNISIDKLLGLNADAERVERNIEVMHVVNDFDSLTAYLRQAHGQLLTFRQMPGFKMTYVARDLPIFHYFAFPELGALKALTWVHESIEGKPRLKDVPTNLLNAGMDLYEFYKTTNCTEIWSVQTLHNTLQNIIYYKEVGVLSKTLAMQLLSQLSGLLSEQKMRVLRYRDHNAYGGLIHSPFIMMSNGALLRIGETVFGMLAISSIQTIVVHVPQLLASLNTSIQWHLHHGVALHMASEAVVNAFFEILDSKVVETKKQLQAK